LPECFADSGKKPILGHKTRNMRLLILMGLAAGLALGAASPAFSQTQLPGLWKGFITVGGLNSTQGYPFELYLQKRGRTLSGRTLIYLTPTRVFEMEVIGHLYDDNSVHLEEVKSSSDSSEQPPFLRKYQLIFNRGIYDSSLNGHWQEINTDPLNSRRELGRIMLQKAPPGKA
jgi:hypothetical protein